MKCKGCGQEITKVQLYCTCWQIGYLDGNKIIDYVVEEIEETTGIECPECGTDLTEDVELS
jgi:DNA-directed RNA polymerase subunit RPC12/RpoP